RTTAMTARVRATAPPATAYVRYVGTTEELFRRAGSAGFRFGGTGLGFDCGRGRGGAGVCTGVADTDTDVVPTMAWATGTGVRRGGRGGGTALKSTIVTSTAGSPNAARTSATSAAPTRFSGTA